MSYWGVVKGCWATKREGFRLSRLTVGASNDLQMERNFTRGLLVIYQGHSANLGPFRERFSPFFALCAYFDGSMVFSDEFLP